MSDRAEHHEHGSDKGSITGMFPLNSSKEQVVSYISNASELEFAQLMYSQRIGATFIHIHLFEDMLINAMWMCDKILVGKVLGKDQAAWEKTLIKRKNLQASTLGSLITILSRNGIPQRDTDYLKWIKNKRDHVVHRLFHDGGWPGDCGVEECQQRSRGLRAVDLWLERAGRQVWRIFERAGLVAVTDMGEDGLLITNTDLLSILNTELHEED